MIGDTATANLALVLVEATPDGYREKGRLEGLLAAPPGPHGPECYTQPALASGRLYLRDHGQLVCLEVAGPGPGDGR